MINHHQVIRFHHINKKTDFEAAYYLLKWEIRYNMKQLEILSHEFS
ncbi:hypothetical protein [Vibrio phage MZH0603]|nr:hypothetical protein [Vibrio phage MZH0603]